MRRKVSIRVSLRGMLRLIRVDTLRRGRNVCFLAGLFIYYKANSWKSNDVIHKDLSLIRKNAMFKHTTR